MTDDDEQVRQLEATAVVASKVSQGVAKSAIERARWSAYIRESVIVILVVIVGLLSYQALTESGRLNKIVQDQNDRRCASLRKSSLIQATPTTTSVGLQILAQSRNNYYINDCEKDLGRLPPPLPAMKPFLIQEAQH